MANQIYNRFKAEGKELAAGDIQIVDSAEFNYYQPGWCVVNIYSIDSCLRCL